MDQSDRATAREAEMNKDALAEVQRIPVLPFTGECHNCGESIRVGKFCDSDCRDDFERRERIKNRDKGRRDGS